MALGSALVYMIHPLPLPFETPIGIEPGVEREGPEVAVSVGEVPGARDRLYNGACIEAWPGPVRQRRVHGIPRILTRYEHEAQRKWCRQQDRQFFHRGSSSGGPAFRSDVTPAVDDLRVGRRVAWHVRLAIASLQAVSCVG